MSVAAYDGTNPHEPNAVAPPCHLSAKVRPGCCLPTFDRMPSIGGRNVMFEIIRNESSHYSSVVRSAAPACPSITRENTEPGSRAARVTGSREWCESGVTRLPSETLTNSTSLRSSCPTKAALDSKTPDSVYISPATRQPNHRIRSARPRDSLRNPQVIMELARKPREFDSTTLAVPLVPIVSL